MQTEKEYAKLNAEKQQQQHKRTYDNLGSKFQDVQKKWFAVDQCSPEPPPAMEATTTSTGKSNNNRRIPSGSTPVKSLTERFDSGGDTHHHALQHNESEILRSVVNEQRREIETLRGQLAAKDERIRQLEMRMKETVLISSDYELTKA